MFIPQAVDGTPAHYETTYYDTTPIVTDFKTAQENVDRVWKNQQRIARNDAKQRNYVEACKLHERKFEAFMDSLAGRNVLSQHALIDAYLRNHPAPKPPVFEK